MSEKSDSDMNKELILQNIVRIHTHICHSSSIIQPPGRPTGQIIYPLVNALNIAQDIYIVRLDSYIASHFLEEVHYACEYN